MAGVTDKPRPSRLALALIAGLLVVFAAAYIAGYFLLSGYEPTTSVRYFRSEWPIAIYEPAAALESSLTGKQIELQCWP